MGASHWRSQSWVVYVIFFYVFNAFEINQSKHFYWSRLQFYLVLFWGVDGDGAGGGLESSAVQLESDEFPVSIKNLQLWPQFLGGLQWRWVCLGSSLDSLFTKTTSKQCPVRMEESRRERPQRHRPSACYHSHMEKLLGALPFNYCKIKREIFLSAS